METGVHIGVGTGINRETTDSMNGCGRDLEY